MHDSTKSFCVEKKEEKAQKITDVKLPQVNVN